MPPLLRLQDRAAAFSPVARVVLFAPDASLALPPLLPPIPARGLVALIPSLHELDADRRRHLHGLAGRRERSRVLINTEYRNRVAPLIRRQQPFAARIDVEVSWRLSAGRRVADRAKLERRGRLGRLLNLETGNGVVAAIGAVDELAGRMDHHFGGGARRK